MRSNYYNQYILSPEWRAKADEAKRRAGYRCQVCNKRSGQVTLHAHHRTYERLGHELPEDITVLCASCHELYHQNKKLQATPSPSRAPAYRPVVRTAPSKPVDTVTIYPRSASSGGIQQKTSSAGKAVMLLVALIVVLFSIVWATSSFSTTTVEQSLTSHENRLLEAGDTVLYRAVTKATAKVHSGPGTDHQVIETLGPGMVINVVGYQTTDDERWYLLAEGNWVLGEHIHAPTSNVPALLEQTASKPSSRANTVELGTTATKKPRPTRTPSPTSVPTATSAALGCAGGCTQYPTWCAPPIKGNVSYNSGERIYHVPGQAYYENTKISPSYGERWFCTESEARQAGWRKSYR